MMSVANLVPSVTNTHTSCLATYRYYHSRDIFWGDVIIGL